MIKRKDSTMGGDYESREMIWDRRVGWRSVDCIDGFEGLGRDGCEGTIVHTSHDCKK